MKKKKIDIFEDSDKEEKKKRKRQLMKNDIVETKSFIRCKSCGTLQLKKLINKYWCAENSGKVDDKTLWKSTCRYCGHPLKGK